MTLRKIKRQLNESDAHMVLTGKKNQDGTWDMSMSTSDDGVWDLLLTFMVHDTNMRLLLTEIIEQANGHTED